MPMKYTSKLEETEINGYPTTLNCKYLGFAMSNTINVRDHIILITSPSNSLRINIRVLLKNMHL